jgi:multicomponent K+:H+ antiporter subunit F
MMNLALAIAFAAVAIATLLTGWRLIRGPSAPDRVLAIDTLYINAVALAVLLGISQNSQALFEAALLIALIGFVSTVALARYVQRGNVVE